MFHLLAVSRKITFFTAAVGAAAAPAAAADGVPDAVDEIGSASELGDAAEKAVNEAEDSLLIKDLLGKEVKGVDGDTIGEIENFVVVPGGRIVAALVETDDGTMLALPMAALKLAATADDAGIEVPVPASEVVDLDKLKESAEKLQD